MKFSELFGAMDKKDSNIQDYVKGHQADQIGNNTDESDDRRDRAAEKLPPGIKKELDDRLKRGTI